MLKKDPRDTGETMVVQPSGQPERYTGNEEQKPERYTGAEEQKPERYGVTEDSVQTQQTP